MFIIRFIFSLYLRYFTIHETTQKQSPVTGVIISGERIPDSEGERNEAAVKCSYECKFQFVVPITVKFQQPLDLSFFFRPPIALRE